MTLKETAKRLFDQAIGGYFNGEKFTEKRLYDTIVSGMKNCEYNAIKNAYVMQIALPDGWWYCKVTKYGNKADEYDYYIPETREQEQKLKDKFFAN